MELRTPDAHLTQQPPWRDCHDVEQTIEDLIDLLDLLDGEADLGANGDDEPSLGWVMGSGSGDGYSF
jgi:hypothetical protein